VSDGPGPWLVSRPDQPSPLSPARPRLPIPFRFITDTDTSTTVVLYRCGTNDLPIINCVQPKKKTAYPHGDIQSQYPGPPKMNLAVIIKGQCGSLRFPNYPRAAQRHCTAKPLSLSFFFSILLTDLRLGFLSGVGKREWRMECEMKIPG
jgi:hypothetical protein